MTPLQPPPNSTVDLTNGDAVQPEWRRWFLTIRNLINVFPGNLPATATNDNAAAGNVGEFISSTVLIGSAAALTTNVAANVTSISLTRGDWDVRGTVVTNPAAGTTQTAIEGAISTVSATLPTWPAGGAITSIFTSFQTGVLVSIPTGTTRLSLAVTTTVYLVALSVFGVSTNAAYGFIGARRVR